MGPIGFPEMLVIAVLALLIFGPRKLPELARSLGKALAEFRRASNDIRMTIEEEVREAEHQARDLGKEVEKAVVDSADSSGSVPGETTHAIATEAPTESAESGPDGEPKHA